MVSLANNLDQIKAIYSKFEDSKYVLKNFGKPETKGKESSFKTREIIFLNKKALHLSYLSQALYMSRVIVYYLERALNPLTYLAGVIDDNQNVLVDYGTGYFVERNVDQAISFCERKAALIKENREKLAPVLAEKKKAIEQIEIALAKKLQSSQIQKVSQSVTK